MPSEKEILHNIFQNLFYFKYSENITSIDEINSGSSNRKIYRLKSEHNNCIGIYNEYIDENTAFIEFSKSLKSLGLNVPEFYCVSNDNKYYLIEDFGNTNLYSFSKQKNVRKDELMWFYKKALKDLTEFQTRAVRELNFDLCYETKILDRTQFEYDLMKFQKYYINKFIISPDEILISSAFEEILNQLPTSRNEYFVYRDFQPRNIMIKQGELFYIDYQSGRKGPLQYDPASFLYSGSIIINEDERSELLEYYLSELCNKVHINEKSFIKSYYYFVLLRLLQVLGSYGFNYQKRKDNNVLFKVPQALKNIESIILQFENKYILNFLMLLLDPKNFVRFN